MNAILNQLKARKPGLEKFDAIWKEIDDVINHEIKCRTIDGWKSEYIPQGRLEAKTEYSRRIELTPFFPQTPHVMASRLGSIFSDGMNITAAGLEGFLKAAGRNHQSFEDIAGQVCTLAQAHGYCAAIIDRPKQKDENDIILSQHDVEKRARPYIALYTAENILDWEHGSDGRLAWIKFHETCITKATPLSDPIEITRYVIVDRNNTTVYTVTYSADKTPIITSPGAQSHGFGRVPVATLHPFPGIDGIGRPIVRRLAESDITATRALSDIVWGLYLLGNPILTYLTDKREEELQNISAQPSRYIPLKNGVPGQSNPEKLEFVQLDAMGLELQFRAHALFTAQGQATTPTGTGQEVQGGAAIPIQQSGIARAWEFHTGEERILLMLKRAMKPFLEELLSLAALALNLSCTPIVEFPIKAPTGPGTKNGTE